MAKLSDGLAQCFPAEGPIWAYMQWAHPLTHTPPVLHLASILPVMGYELCRRGFTVPSYGMPRAWFGVVAPSSVAKTSTLHRARDFCSDFYAEQFQHEALRPKPWVSLEGSLPGVLHAISAMRDERGRTCGILYHNEFSRVLRSDDALEPLNMIYDGQDYDRNLRYLQKLADKGEDVKAVIKAPAFSAVVTTTPAALERVSRPDTIEGGFFQRVLWIRTGLLKEDLKPRPTDDHVGRRFALDIWSRWFGYFEALRVQGLSPEIHFEPAADHWLDENLFRALEDLIVRESFEAGVAMRARHHAANIAAVYAATRVSIADNHIWVTQDDVWRAANLVIACLQSARTLGGQLHVKTMDLPSKLQTLLDFICDRDIQGCTRREAYNVFHRHVGKVEMEMIISVLLDGNFVVEQVQIDAHAGAGRPPRKLYTPDAWARLTRKSP